MRLSFPKLFASILGFVPSRTDWETTLDRFGIWLVAAVVLILISFAPFFATSLPPRMIPPGFKAI